MTDFVDRRKAFEKKFEHEGEMNFKVASRAAKLFGHWAATKLELTDTALDTYVAQVLETDLVSPRRGEILNKVEMDFKAKGIEMPRRHLLAEYERFVAVAHTKVMTE